MKDASQLVTGRGGSALGRLAERLDQLGQKRGWTERSKASFPPADRGEMDPEQGAELGLGQTQGLSNAPDPVALDERA